MNCLSSYSFSLGGRMVMVIATAIYLLCIVWYYFSELYEYELFLDQIWLIGPSDMSLGARLFSCWFVTETRFIRFFIILSKGIWGYCCIIWKVFSSDKNGKGKALAISISVYLINYIVELMPYTCGIIEELGAFDWYGNLGN